MKGLGRTFDIFVGIVIGLLLPYVVKEGIRAYKFWYIGLVASGGNPDWPDIEGESYQEKSSSFEELEDLLGTLEELGNALGRSENDDS